MNKKFFVLTISIFLLSSGYVFAHGDEKAEHKGSMMECKGSMKGCKGSMMEHDESSEQFSKGAVEVGNKICPVSNKPVNSNGGKVQVEYEGKMYNVCCKFCAKDFKKNPEKFVKIVEEEMTKEDATKEMHHKGSSMEKMEHDH